MTLAASSSRSHRPYRTTSGPHPGNSRVGEAVLDMKSGDLKNALVAEVSPGVTVTLAPGVQNARVDVHAHRETSFGNGRCRHRLPAGRVAVHAHVGMCWFNPKSMVTQA